MFLGVPYVPFFLGAGSCVLMAAWFNLVWLLALPPVIGALRLLARQDEMIFRLLGIRFQFLFKARNRRLHAGMWAFTPNQHSRLP